MILGTAFGIGIAFLTGFAVVAAFWPVGLRRWSDVTLRMALASGMGLGISSVSSFLTFSIWGKLGRVEIFVDITVLAIALCAWWLKSRQRQHVVLTASLRPALSAIQLLLAGAFAAAAAAGVIGFAFLSAKAPHGGWDGWSIWNLHARFLFRGQNFWTDSFSPLLANYKSDYPLLLPTSIARLWNYAGDETLFAPALVSGVFTFATAALLGSLLARSRGIAQGLLGGLVLLGTPTFILQGASQYADVAVAFFLLATLGLLHLYDSSEANGYLLLAGAAAGLGAWTKNEGLMLLVVVLFVRFAGHWRPLGVRVMLRRIAAFLVGLAPGLATLIYFKIRFAPSNDMVAGQGLHATATRLLDLSRYVTVGKAFAWQAFSFGDWFVPIALVLVFYALLVGFDFDHRKITTLTPLLTVLAAATGYFFVFITTPHDLAWHLDRSLSRVLMQLWPAAIFCTFLLLGTLEEAGKIREVENQWAESAVLVEAGPQHPAHQ